MASRIITLAEVRRTYDRLRARYFLDAVPPLRVPPHSSALAFGWLPDNSDAIGETEFDEDGDPHVVRLSPKYSRYTIARETLLHELVHMRLGPGPSCGAYSHRWKGSRVARSMAWYRETLRLAQLGAPLL